MSGNLLTINTGTTHTYSWDAENRIASIDGKTLTYDALDRVVEEGPALQILYGPTGKLGVQSGQINTRTYLGLPKGAQVLYDGISVVYVHPDLMGNGILGTNNAQGKVFDRLFAPFGEEYGNSGTTVANFTGNMQDLDANLYDYTYREQSPVQGRWLNPDPSGMSNVSLGDPQTLNRYAYVRGSAMGLTDVNGLGAGAGAGSGMWAYLMSFTATGGQGGINDNGGISGEMTQYLTDTVVTYTITKSSTAGAGQVVTAGKLGNLDVEEIASESVKKAKHWYNIFTKLVEHSKLENEMDADRSMFEMASKVVWDPLSGNNSKIQAPFTEIYRLEQVNLTLDAIRQGKATGDDVGAFPEVLGKTYDDAFNRLGAICDQNNEQIQGFLEQAAAIITPQ